MFKTIALWTAVVPVIFFASSLASAPPENVHLVIATLHAAALTSSHSAKDAADSPFFVVSVVGPRSSSATILPDNGPASLHRDEALGARPLTDLSLAEGDSVQVLVSVLENAARKPSDRAAIEASSSKSRATSPAEQVAEADRLVAPLVKQGANVVGSVSLLLTNEGGAVYWRRIDCVASCKVVSAPEKTALPAANGQPSGGTVELTGSGGTYHLALRANRAS